MDVKWIKLSTDFFNDDKIRLLMSKDDGPVYISLWVTLLTIAGRFNCHGKVAFVEGILPEESEICSYCGLSKDKKQSVSNGIEQLLRFGMLSQDEEGYLHIANWGKHQNVEKLDEIREQNRLRQHRYREKLKEKVEDNVTDNVTRNVTRNESNALVTLPRSYISNTLNTEEYKEIILYLNERTGKRFNPKSKKTLSLVAARAREGYHKEDFIRVIDIKCKKWLKDEKMFQFLRPITLFSTKFESYLNEEPPEKEFHCKYCDNTGVLPSGDLCGCKYGREKLND